MRLPRIPEWQPLFLRKWAWPCVEIKISEDNPPNRIYIWNRKGMHWVESMGLLEPIAHHLERRIVSWTRTDTMRPGIAKVPPGMLHRHHCCWSLNPSQPWFMRLISQGEDSWADTPNWPLRGRVHVYPPHLPELSQIIDSRLIKQPSKMGYKRSILSCPAETFYTGWLSGLKSSI